MSSTTQPTAKASDQVTAQQVFDAMERYGGGFVTHLGACWRRADRLNAARLMSVFGDEYYEEYAKRALLDAREGRP